MDKKRIFINASLLKVSSCIRRAYWHSIIRFRPRTSTVEAEFGKAVHIFINAFRQNGGKANEALKMAKEAFAQAKYPIKPKKQWMNEQRLEAACVFWQAHWIAENDDLITLTDANNKPVTELKGAIPFWSNDKCEVILDFVIDDLCRKGTTGAFCVRDYKTTQAWDIPNYLADYKLNPQMLFYYVIIEEYAKLYPDSIYAEIVRTGFGCLIEGIFLKEYGEIKIQRSDMFMYDAETISGFRRCLLYFIYHLAGTIEHNCIPLPEGMMNGSCKFCDFAKVCSAVDPVAGEYVLQNNFIVKPSTTLESV